MEKEVWKDIIVREFSDGVLKKVVTGTKISNLGRIMHDGTIVEPMMVDSQLRIPFEVDGEINTKYPLSVAVASKFIPRRGDDFYKTRVAFINDDHTDCRASNLKWVD